MKIFFLFFLLNFGLCWAFPPVLAPQSYVQSAGFPNETAEPLKIKSHNNRTYTLTMESSSTEQTRFLLTASSFAPFSLASVQSHAVSNVPSQVVFFDMKIDSASSKLFLVGLIRGEVDIPTNQSLVRVASTKQGLIFTEDILILEYQLPSLSLNQIYQFASEGDERGTGIETDQAGNIYLTGQTHNSTGLDLGANTYSGMSLSAAVLPNLSQSNSTFVMKYGPNFSPAPGFPQLITTGNSVEEVTDLELDELSSNPALYVTGSSAQSAFITKMNLNGSSLWTKLLTPSSPSSHHNKILDLRLSDFLASTGKRSFFVTGALGGETVLSASQTLTPQDTGDTLVAKYDGDGQSLWAFLLEGSAAGRDYGNSLEIDSCGRLIVAGYSQDPLLDFNPSPNSTNHASSTNLIGSNQFLAFYDTQTGQYLWGDLFNSGQGADQGANRSFLMGNMMSDDYHSGEHMVVSQDQKLSLLFDDPSGQTDFNLQPSVFHFPNFFSLSRTLSFQYDLPCTPLPVRGLHLQAESLSSLQVGLQWQVLSLSPIKEFILIRKKVTGEIHQHVLLPAELDYQKNTFHFTDTPPPQDDVLTYEVEARGFNGDTTRSNSVLIKREASLQLAASFQSDTLQLTFQGDSSLRQQACDISLFSLEGKRLLYKKLVHCQENTLSFNQELISQGAYIVQVHFAQGHVIRKKVLKKHD